jgi:two-component system OmpR family sensor kinase
MMSGTLKARLTLWNLAVLATALTLFAVLLYAWLARTMYGHHDDDLTEDAQRVVHALEASDAPLEALSAQERSRMGLTFLMVRNARGEIVFRTSRLAATEPDIGEHSVLVHAAMQGATDPQFFTVRLAQGLTRFICMPLANPAGTYLQVGRSLGDVDLLLRVVVVGSAVLVPLVLALTGFGAFVSTRRALRPIEHIASSLESIQATDLSRRIDGHASDEEVRRLNTSINHLLDRLNTSFTALKEFTADVSHQLQTPLTVMRGTIDVARNGAAPRDALLDDLAKEVDALAATLHDLRDYALADAESSSGRMAPVDVSPVFEEAAEVVRALAEAHDVACAVSIVSRLHVWGNAVRLRQVLLNIGENAVQATSAGGRIDIRAHHENGDVVLQIADTGNGIPADVRPHIFDRSFRSGGAGSPARSGLGLAIVSRIVAAHHGRINVESTVGRGTTITVAIPAAA